MKRQISSYKGRKLCLWQRLLALGGAGRGRDLCRAVRRGALRAYDHIQGDPGRWWCWAAR